MNSLRLLVATALLAVAAAQPTSSWEILATQRDKTEECKELVQYAPDDKKCPHFDKCCTFDPLNGDKCQDYKKICQEDDDGKFIYSCKYTNCTAMITTTTTTTTQSPRQVNAVAAPVSSLCLLISAVLPRFLF